MMQENNKYIIKAQRVLLPLLLMLEHPVSLGRFIAVLCSAEVKQLYEADSSGHCTGTSTCLCAASSSSSSFVGVTGMDISNLSR